MPDNKNVGTAGYIDQQKYTVVVAPGHEEYVKELLQKAGLVMAICPTGHEAFHEELKTPAVPRLRNRETWRGKGKRKMPRGGRYYGNQYRR